MDFYQQCYNKPMLLWFSITTSYKNNITWNTSNGGSGDLSGKLKPSGSVYGSSKMIVCVIL